MTVFAHEGTLQIIPDRNIEELRGFLKGINTDVERGKDRA